MISAEPQYKGVTMDTATTTFPRIRSAGLRGAKAVGNAQMVTVTVGTTKDNAVIKVPTTNKRDASGKHQQAQGTPLPSK